MATGTAKTKWILELQDEITSDLKGLDKAVKETRDDFDGLNETVGDGGEGLQDFAASYDDVLSGLRSGDLGAIEGGWRGVASGIQGATKAGLAFLGTPIGLGITALAGIALATREWAAYNEEARQANLITQQITRLSDDALDNARIRAKVLSESFDVDFKRVLELAKNNVRAFDITFDEALDNIQDGLVRGGSVNDEYLDSMREYPRLFAEAGFSMQDFQRVVNTGIDEGIYSDKLPDAIKEFGISMREQTDTTRDALENAFGKSFTDNILGGITDGSIAPREALIEITKEADRVKLNAQQSAQLTADVFRGAGEDVGGLKVILEGVTTALIDEEAALTPLQQNIKNVTQATLELEEAQNRALQSDNYAYLANQAKLGWLEVKTTWYNAINELTTLATTWMDDSVVEIVSLITTVRGIPAQFKIAFQEIKDEAADVVGVFGQLGGIAGNLFDLKFGAALEGARKFKDDLKKEVGDVADTGSNAIARAVALNGATKAEVRAQLQKDRVGAAEASKQGGALDIGGFEDLGGGGSGDGGGTGDSVGKRLISGNSGSGKTINMTLNIENIFKVTDGAAGEIENIADKIISRITDRLRDSTIALG